MTEEIKQNRGTKKPTIIIAVAIVLFAPFAVILGLHVGNAINAICPDINLNPFGIDNVSWFGFWGAYLGGICTLIAFVFTVENNNKNLAKTIEENQRQIKYQQEIQNISQEQKIISEVVSTLSPIQVVGYYYSLIQLPFGNKPLQTEQISHFSSIVHQYQQQLISNKVKLCMEAGICNQSCEVCKNIDDCNLGKIKKDFYGKFWDVYNKIYSSSIDFLEFVNTVIKSPDIKYSDGEARKILANKEFPHQMRIDAQKDLDAIKSISANIGEKKEIVNHDVNELKIIHYEKINDLILLAQSYISERQQLALSRLDGIETLKFEIDKVKAEMVKRKQDEEIKRVYQEEGII